MNKTVPSPFGVSAKSICAVALGALLLITGCVVRSVYPYYHAKDLTFAPELLGSWVEAKADNAEKETWTFEKLDGHTYKLIVADHDKKTEFDTHLFRLNGLRFLDLFPRERPDNSLPLHFLMRVDAVSPQLELRLLNYDWLVKLVEKNPRVIRHLLLPKQAGAGDDGGDLVLTADTEELQKFIGKHLKTAGAWSDPAVLKRH